MTMRLETRLECVKSSPRVLGVYQNGAKEFVERRLRLVGRLSRVVERLVESLERALQRVMCGPCDFPLDVFRLLTLYSCSVEVLARRSWALGCPSGDPKSTVVPSSSAPNDSGDGKALATMRSCFNIDSTVTARRLIDVRKDCYVPPEYELHVPLPGQHPYDVFPSGFGLSTNALEVGLSFPLHPVIEACLEGWQI
ncbi:hypothetical protein BHM03_00057109 [Ensete ventricosum]|nr:hypothetical protein BHM03_00057109 [Ensete ventricosum]